MPRKLINRKQRWLLCTGIDAATREVWYESLTYWGKVRLGYRINRERIAASLAGGR